MPEPGQDSNRKLRVFLCHASGDKPAVRKLYQRLVKDGVAPWLDEEDLAPGQDWEVEIRKAVQASDIVLVCLSLRSITKEGFVQKEIKFALDAADEKPQGTIFLILRAWQIQAVSSFLAARSSKCGTSSSSALRTWASNRSRTSLIPLEPTAYYWMLHPLGR